MGKNEEKSKSITGICAVILLAGILGCWLVMSAAHGTIVQVVQDGTVLHTIDLSKTEDQSITVHYEGRSNTIQIENGKIRVIAAECPDHTCVNMGWLDSSLPIVCLPNHLVIQFARENNELDAVAE